jgi:hypothetical protein
MADPKKAGHGVARVRDTRTVSPRALEVLDARRSCSSLVLMKETAEQVTPTHLVPSGLAVTPSRSIRLASSSMNTSTYSRSSHTVSTIKKSHVTMPADANRAIKRHSLT